MENAFVGQTLGGGGSSQSKLGRFGICLELTKNSIIAPTYCPFLVPGNDRPSTSRPERDTSNHNME